MNCLSWSDMITIWMFILWSRNYVPNKEFNYLVISVRWLQRDIYFFYFFSCYLRLATCELRVATCDLRLATCCLRVATCELLLATCDLRLATCELRVATCELLLATCELRIPRDNDSLVNKMESRKETDGELDEVG